MSEITPDEQIDLKGLTCPMPLLKIKKQLKSMDSGKILCAVGTDPGTKNDIQKACDKDGHQLLRIDEDNGVFSFFIKKG